MTERQQAGRKAAPRQDHLAQAVFSLFGGQIIHQAKHMTPDRMAIDASLVLEGVRQLMDAGGYDRQRAIVQAMDDDTATALCKWIMEPDTALAWIRANTH